MKRVAVFFYDHFFNPKPDRYVLLTFDRNLGNYVEALRIINACMYNLIFSLAYVGTKFYNCIVNQVD